MMDQVCKYMTKGLAMQFVGEAQGDLSVISRVLEGEYQLVTPYLVQTINIPSATDFFFKRLFPDPSSSVAVM